MPSVWVKGTTASTTTDCEYKWLVQVKERTQHFSQVTHREARRRHARRNSQPGRACPRHRQIEISHTAVPQQRQLHVRERRGDDLHASAAMTAASGLCGRRFRGCLRRWALSCLQGVHRDCPGTVRTREQRGACASTAWATDAVADAFSDLSDCTSAGKTAKGVISVQCWQCSCTLCGGCKKGAHSGSAACSLHAEQPKRVKAKICRFSASSGTWRPWLCVHARTHGKDYVWLELPSLRLQASMSTSRFLQ